MSHLARKPTFSAGLVSRSHVVATRSPLPGIDTNNAWFTRDVGSWPIVLEIAASMSATCPLGNGIVVSIDFRSDWLRRASIPQVIMLNVGPRNEMICVAGKTSRTGGTVFRPFRESR